VEFKIQSQLTNLNNLVDEDNKKLLSEVCAWIEKNIDTNIGWEALCLESELSHKELQFLFEKYLQTTPMMYIRKQREEIKKQIPKFTITQDFLSKEE